MRRNRWIDRIRAAGWELIKVEVDGGQFEIRDVATRSTVAVGKSRLSAMKKAVNILDQRESA